MRGTFVVWSYERVTTNIDAPSIPLVDVICKHLDRNDKPWTYEPVRMGISRLASFRIGTIWQNGECIAETDLGNDKVFSLDFTEGAWSCLGLPGNQRHPFFKQDYPLRPVITGDELTHFLNFPLPHGKNLLIPCLEFLVRGYASTPDIGRLLATYPFSTVQQRLYASLEQDRRTWLVHPARQVHDDDALLLASMLYDPYAQHAASEIYAQLDVARGRGKNHLSLKVRPWFQGPAEIRARGRWINGGRTYLCYELTGMSEPQDHPYEIRRPRYTEQDPSAKVVSIVNRERDEIPKPDDPFEITDTDEPHKDAAEWRKPDPGFARLGPKCPVTRSIQQRPYSKKKILKAPPAKTTTLSTGDRVGNSDVGKRKNCAKRVAGDGGVLKGIWDELVRLKDVQPGFSSLEYLSNHSFQSGSVLKLQALRPFNDQDEPTPEAIRWLKYNDNASRIRGIMILRVVIGGRNFYLFEPQRKQKRRKDSFYEESSFGLLIEIPDVRSAEEQISHICDKIRFHSGKFGALKELPDSHNLVLHITRQERFYANSTLRNAFLKRGVELVR
ncbi:hypothetical protein V0R50_29385 [Pseudomonas sp. 148P]|uniref:Uncharacterized protein n=1 Tax=Pseudomonas ulcerans TaxID=3115852 RepID=A0ABU7I0K6_9PSED|nr:MULTISPECIES: hypothetical protein [unclassified Pseudomonas]MEE1926081.1 hypothetical protein [Pseudomonas sp. 147P]MEE1937357.1 hypothetical protein [Pseudomonas sp. 148P]